MSGPEPMSRSFRRPLLALVISGLLSACGAGKEPTGARVADYLGAGAGEGFARAQPGHRLAFPQDHGAHPRYQSEWWYFTGNLEGDAGRHFGFMFTIFRFALTPEAALRASEWGTNQAWMAHFAVTDTEGQALLKSERFARGGAGLAGASADPFRVWLYDWSASAAGGDGPFPMRLSAREDDYAVELDLSPAKPLVLQGEQGYSQKGREPGNASHYYAYTRLEARGQVVLDGEAHEVTGSAWMDREWSTSALGDDLAGWDWFALQLDDGRDLMFYQLRREDGGRGPFSQGALVAADGTRRGIAPADVRLKPRKWWRSSETGRRYPVSWRMRIDSLNLDLEIAARLPAQEMNLNVAYWEGAVSVTGSRGERGVGYLEMTGY